MLCHAMRGMLHVDCALPAAAACFVASFCNAYPSYCKEVPIADAALRMKQVLQGFHGHCFICFMCLTCVSKVSGHMCVCVGVHGGHGGHGVADEDGPTNMNMCLTCHMLSEVV